VENSFKKYERLKGKKEIASVFENGRKTMKYPILAFYLLSEKEEKQFIKMGVSVPKKKIKLAVKRNLVKRRIKEAHRLLKQDLNAELQAQGKSLDLMFIYQANTIYTFAEIQDKINCVFQRLLIEIKTNEK
jgi:ribonuclease P protein component